VIKQDEDRWGFRNAGCRSRTEDGFDLFARQVELLDALVDAQVLADAT